MGTIDYNGDEEQSDVQFRTSILNDAVEGSEAAQDLLAPLIYAKLRRLARSFLSRERSGHTLQPTDLVHEAYLRLFDQTKATQKNETHFVALAAVMMRRILVNHAIAKRTVRRGSGAFHVTLSAAEFVEASGDNAQVDIVALDTALVKMSELDERMARIVELRYFGGMSIDETANALNISSATVKREWVVAKQWLKKELCN